MNRLRTRLFWNMLTVLLIGMGVAAVLAWRTVETLYLDTQRENLLAQARITADAMYGTQLPGFRSYSQAIETVPEVQLFQQYNQTSNTLPGIHTRVLSSQGTVIFSLPLSQDQTFYAPVENAVPVSAQEMLARPEIVSAMRGVADTAIRAVTGRSVLYAAAPVFAYDGTVSGLVYLTMPLPAAGLPLNLVLQLVGVALFAVTLALLTGTFLARRLVAPLEKVAAAAGAVSAGDLEQRVPVGGEIRELDELAQSFNHMTESLRQADQAKNAFVADVTHELRTPLTVIRGTIETLQDGALDDLEGRGPLLDSMQREAERLTRMVNDLLLLARADARTLDVEREPLDLAELARTRCTHLAGLAARQHVRLEVTGAESAMVMGDADRLAQALDNLIDNAIRYSPAGSVVTVEIGLGGGECQCAVRDHGSGIPAEHLPFIFERFYRADASRNRRTGGAGLGLAIVRALIEAQGGRVSAESQVGEGTTMRFWLPAN
jgi:heavy metal sensor kinase